VSLVIDASVALAWCFEDEQTPMLMALLDRVAAEGAVAPQLWPVEVLNGLLTAERRGRIGAAERREVLGLLHQLPIAVDGETAAQAWSATQAIADSEMLTAYDAAYLELAMRLGVPLATMDRLLAEAARKRGVPLLGTA
jgi:predicted nucleic acid-binding protein